MLDLQLFFGAQTLSLGISGFLALISGQIKSLTMFLITNLNDLKRGVLNRKMK